MGWFLFPGSVSGVVIQGTECPATPESEKFPADFATASWQTLVSVPFSSSIRQDLFLNITTETAAFFRTTTALANDSLTIRISNRISKNSRLSIIPMDGKGLVHGERECAGVTVVNSFYRDRRDDVIRVWFDEEFVFVVACYDRQDGWLDVAILIFATSNDGGSIISNLLRLKEFTRKNLGAVLTGIVPLGGSEITLTEEQQESVICPSSYPNGDAVVAKEETGHGNILIMEIIVVSVISCVGAVGVFLVKKL